MHRHSCYNKPMITYFQAIVIAIVQGVTELFPISSLGHSVLIANLFGWNNLVSEQTQKASLYLVFLIALHVATAIALIIFYRKTWLQLIKAFIQLCRTRKIETTEQRVILLLIVATIPAALIGLVFERPLTELFAYPVIAAVFLMVNGTILLFGDSLKKRSSIRRLSQQTITSTEEQIARRLRPRRAVYIGIAQSAALIAGISRSGVSMVGGLLVGLSYESAARFSFLLATPIILGAGLYKLPELAKPAYHSILPQALIGAVIAGVAAYLSVKFLDKYFANKTFRPFAIYCLAFGAFMTIFSIITH